VDHTTILLIKIGGGLTALALTYVAIVTLEKTFAMCKKAFVLIKDKINSFRKMHFHRA